MLQTVEAEIDIDGNIRLCEPVQVSKPTRAIVTLLEEAPPVPGGNGNAADVLKLLRSPEFANRKSYSAEEIEAQIQENRESWD